MPRPKKSQDPSERERLEVLLEEMRSEFRTVAEVVTSLNARVGQLEQSISQLTQAVIELRLELHRIADRLETHEKAHAS